MQPYTPSRKPKVTRPNRSNTANNGSAVGDSSASEARSENVESRFESPASVRSQARRKAIETAELPHITKRPWAMMYEIVKALAEGRVVSNRRLLRTLMAQIEATPEPPPDELLALSKFRLNTIKQVIDEVEAGKPMSTTDREDFLSTIESSEKESLTSHFDNREAITEYFDACMSAVLENLDSPKEVAGADSDGFSETNDFPELTVVNLLREELKEAHRETERQLHEKIKELEDEVEDFRRAHQDMVSKMAAQRVMSPTASYQATSLTNPFEKQQPTQTFLPDEHDRLQGFPPSNNGFDQGRIRQAPPSSSMVLPDKAPENPLWEMAELMQLEDDALRSFLHDCTKDNEFRLCRPHNEADELMREAGSQNSNVEVIAVNVFENMEELQSEVEQLHAEIVIYKADGEKLRKEIEGLKAQLLSAESAAKAKAEASLNAKHLESFKKLKTKLEQQQAVNNQLWEDEKAKLDRRIKDLRANLLDAQITAKAKAVVDAAERQTNDAQRGAEKDDKRDKDRDEKRDRERDKSRDKDRDEKRDRERDESRDTARDKERDAERDSTRDKKRDGVRDKAGDETRDATRDRIVETKRATREEEGQAADAATAVEVDSDGNPRQSCENENENPEPAPVAPTTLAPKQDPIPTPDARLHGQIAWRQARASAHVIRTHASKNSALNLLLSVLSLVPFFLWYMTLMQVHNACAIGRFNATSARCLVLRLAVIMIMLYDWVTKVPGHRVIQFLRGWYEDLGIPHLLAWFRNTGCGANLTLALQNSIEFYTGLWALTGPWRQRSLPDFSIIRLRTTEWPTAPSVPHDEFVSFLSFVFDAYVFLNWVAVAMERHLWLAANDLTGSHLKYLRYRHPDPHGWMPDFNFVPLAAHRVMIGAVGSRRGRC